MKTIHRFPLLVPLQNPATVRMPKFAKILRVETRPCGICVWATVDTEQKEIEGRRISIFGTGWEIPERIGDYLGTIFEDNFGDTLVWHIYETDRGSAE